MIPSLLTVSTISDLTVDISRLLKDPDSDESSPAPQQQLQQPQHPQNPQPPQQHHPQPHQQQHQQLRPQQHHLQHQFHQYQHHHQFQQHQQQPHQQPRHSHHTRSSSVPSSGLQLEVSSPGFTILGAGVPGKRTMPPHSSESPAKKQSKWSAEEDALIIDLRGGGMKWEDISKRLPGRSAISCRLHYQNYLERRSEWDEERKNKLARLYERFKPEMWSKVAEEMAVPWRAAEAMHWQLGEADMARRAGVVPFSLSNVALEAPPSGHRSSPNRGHSHSQSHSSSVGSSSSASRFGGPATVQSSSTGGRGTAVASSSRTISAGRESTPRSVPPPSPGEGLALAALGGGGMMMGMGRGGAPLLPSVAEMTTGVSPYSPPAYATSMPTSGGGYSSPGPLLPPVGSMAPRPEGKRQRSPEMGARDSSRRRQ
ncbi:uncharacterized protein BP5553_02842 [Venustampulla echinocandica]|uniref:MYB DNA-binding domain-containing protein n=1 Tax=Venustampulla echinocandica TaxID=2656787 RepID=A0A370TSJ1_9HELO|nr:uncharacterized protein BP5553_02842 [Venustampulla echinocandica]RDL38502.1 hypothetical protein BP5553_02842 [Venustampulla echinocandica]